MPLDADGVRRPTSCFWRCPKRRPRSWRRRCSRSGMRVIDLSGAFRLRDDGAAREVVSGDRVAAERRGLRPDRVRARRDQVGAAVVESRLLPDRVAARPAAAAARGPAEAGRRHHHRREVGHLRRGQGGDRSHALLGEPRQRRRLRPVRPPPHAGDGAGARPGGDVRAAPGAARSRHPLEHLCAPRARHDGRGGDRRVRARVCRCAVRAPDRRDAARDQARRAHQLLRHRLEGRRSDRPRVRGERDRQPGEGRGRARRCRTST